MLTVVNSSRIQYDVATLQTINILHGREDTEKTTGAQYGKLTRIVIFGELCVELARRFNKLVLNPKIVPGLTLVDIQRDYRIGLFIKSTILKVLSKKIRSSKRYYTSHIIFIKVNQALKRHEEEVCLKIISRQTAEQIEPNCNNESDLSEMCQLYRHLVFME